MHLYFEQVAELINIIDRNQLAVGIGENLVTPEDKMLLLEFGINYKQLHVGSNSPFNSFNFAMLAESLKAAKENNFSYNELGEYIRRGKYIPQTKREKLTIEHISNQPFEELKVYRQFEMIRQEIITGVKESKTPQAIASNIGHKSGIWNLDDIISKYIDAAFQAASEATSPPKYEGPGTGTRPLIRVWINGRECYL